MQEPGAQPQVREGGIPINPGALPPNVNTYPSDLVQSPAGAALPAPAGPDQQQASTYAAKPMPDESDIDSPRAGSERFDEGRDKLHAAAEARSKKYGIPVKAGGHLTAPANFPSDPGQYADPVNFMFPIHDKVHADNAHTRFAQFGKQYGTAAAKVVLNRIVAAQRRFGTAPAKKPTKAAAAAHAEPVHNDAPSSMPPTPPLPPELPYDDTCDSPVGGSQPLGRYDEPLAAASTPDQAAPVAKPAAAAPPASAAAGPLLDELTEYDEPSPEPGEPDGDEVPPEVMALVRCLYSMVANPRVATDDHDFLTDMAESARGGKAQSIEKIQRAQGIAHGAGMQWPQTMKHLGMPDNRAMSHGGSAATAYRESAQLVQFFKSLDGHETFNVPDVEIFDTGRHKGQKWTIANVKQIAQNYTRLSSKIRPPMKTGHDNALAVNSAAMGEVRTVPVDPRLFDTDSMPALGWVSGVRVREYTDEKGEAKAKLVADFSDVPKLVRDLLKTRAFSRVSSEIYEDFTDPDTGANYGPVLRAVSILGAAMPEVKTLNDVTLLYGERGQTTIVVHSESGGTDVTEAELKARLAEVEAANQRLMTQVRAQAAESRRRDATLFCESLIREGKLTPAQQPLMADLLETAGKIDELADSISEPNHVKLFGEARAGRAMADRVKTFAAALPKVIAFGEQAPLPEAPAPGGKTLGAGGTLNPPTEPVKPGPGAVRIFTDGKNRKFPVQGDALLKEANARVRAAAAIGQVVSLVDAVVAIQIEQQQQEAAQ